MKLVLATVKLVWAILSAAALVGCQPAEMVYVSLPEVSESASFPDLETDAKPETPVEAPPQRSEGCGCGENCPCREVSGECRCGDPPIPDKTLEAIEAYHKEVESHESDSVSSNAGSVESVSDKAPLVIHTWANGACPPCEKWKRECLPALKEAGWIEGKHYQVIEHAPGTVMAPAFLYEGKPFSVQGYGDRASWLGSLRSVMGEGRKPAGGGLVGGVQDAPAGRPSPFVKIHAANQRGSGVLVARQGQRYWVLTNSHVIRGDGGPQGFGRVLGNIRVEADGKQFQAAYVKDDPRLTHDIALVTFLSALDFPTVSLADAAPQNGSPATSHGFPWSGGFIERPTVLYSVFPDGGRATGFVSTATFLSGESGSAVTNANGELVGLVYGNRPDINGVGRGADWSMLREFLGPSPARDVASPGPVPPSRASHTGRGGVPHLRKTPMVGLAEATPRPAYSTR